MICTSEKELNKEIKSNLFATVYLLFGSDSFLVSQYSSLLLKKALGSGDTTFNFDKIDGKKIDFDELYSSTMTLPMMAEYRCVLLDDPEIDKLNAGDIDKLLNIIAELEDGTIFIIAIKQAEFSVKKSTKCKKLHDAVAKKGVVAELNQRTAGELSKLIIKKCSDAGCTISEENSSYIVGRTDGGLLSINSEADKLIAWANGGEITRDAIDKLVCATVEAEIFSLSKAIIARNYTGAMEILSGLLYLREPAVGILSTLSMSFIDLYRAKTGGYEGADAREIAEVFGYKGREFAVKNAMRDSSKLSLSFLKGALEILLTADSKLKSTSADDDIVLQQVVTEIFLLLKER